MTNRDRIVVGVLACVIAIAGFWFLALKPKREAAAAAGARAEAAQTKLLEANSALATAASAKKSFETDYATIARLGKAVPEDDDAASLVFQIETAARKAGIDFRSLSVGGSGVAAATPAPAQSSNSSSSSSESSEGSESEESSDGSSSSGSGSASSTTPSTAAPVPPSPLPPGVVAGTDGMNRLPFTFTFDGDYFALTKLLDLLRSFAVAKGDTVTVRGRLLTVEGVNLEKGRKGFPEVKATVVATAYLSSQPITIPGGTPAGAPATPNTQPDQTAPSTQAAGGSTSLPAATVTPGVLP